MMIQKWKPIEGFENYYAISNYGIIKRIQHMRVSKNKTKNFKFLVKEKILKQYKNHKGYYLVTLYKPKVRKTFAVHRLVAKHFIKGNFKLQVNHIDGNKTNNISTNLEWCTCRENIQHAIKNNLRKPFGPNNTGENNARAKLNQKKVKEIRKIYNSGKKSYSQLAKKYGVVKSTIAQVIKQRTWRKND